jgi:hypothetical protein
VNKVELRQLTTTSFKGSGFNFAVFSDIHLNHPRNPAERIVGNLNAALPDNAETAALDAIFIAGDIFDRLMMFNDISVVSVKLWVNRLLNLCKKHNIILVILEGTPLHDRRQSQYFIMENTIGEIGAEVYYVDVIDILYIEKLDIHLLCVPDEPPGGPVVAMQTVKDLMRHKGLEQVDVAIMHGMFKFQAEYLDAHASYDEAEFQKLVKGPIFIGHDHTYKYSGNIYVQGSFDRLGHGYESPKGHMRAKHLPDGEWEIRFVENTNAMQFITLDCTGKTIDATLDMVDARIPTLHDDANVRIMAEENHPIFSNMEFLIRLGPTITWSKKAVRDKAKAIAPLADTTTKFIPITINRENISELLLERLANEGASGQTLDAAIDILEEMFPWTRNKPIIPTQPMAEL